MNKSPDAFRTISEVAEQLEVPAHVLRFWETRFSQVKPVKRGGGRRYYRPDDVRLLRGIRGLLYDDGMTIKGVQRILREQGVRHVIGLGTVDGVKVPALAPPARKASSTMAAVRPAPAGAETRAVPEPADGSTQDLLPAQNTLIEEAPMAVQDGKAVPESGGNLEPEATEPRAERITEDQGAAGMSSRSADRAALSRLVVELEALRRVMAEEPRS